MSPRFLLPLALATLIAARHAPAQQRPVFDISGSTSACQDARISPDAQFVAYRVGNRLATVRTAGSSEITLLTSATLGTFVWSATGSSVFVVDGNNVVALARAGGGALTLATVPGQSIWLWDVDDGGTWIFGTRYDPAAQRYHAFRLRTNGSQPHQDLFDSQDELTELHVDVTGQYLLYLQRPVVPFAPFTLMRAHVDGTNQSDMLGAPVGVVAQGPAWLDAGDRAVVVTTTQQASLQVVRVDRLTQTAEPLTWAFVHQRPTVSPDGRWIVMAAVDGVGGNGPALLPAEGGGEVLLNTAEAYTYAGSPAADGVGDHVVWSASRVAQSEPARVFRVDLDGEMRVHPRAEVGRVLNFELPCAATEFGAVMIGQRSAPIRLPAARYDFDLGASFAILAIAPGSGTAPISVPLPIPNLPLLQGIVIDFQGLRWDPVARRGEWTRSGRFPIF